MTEAAYVAWRTAFQEHCIRLYRQAQFMKEIAALMERGSKIDHPLGGSKDTTDAAAGAYFNAVSSSEVHSLGISRDSAVIEGVYSLAKVSPADPFGFFSMVNPRKTPVFKV